MNTLNEILNNFSFFIYRNNDNDTKIRKSVRTITSDCTSKSYCTKWRSSHTNCWSCCRIFTSKSHFGYITTRRRHKCPVNHNIASFARRKSIQYKCNNFKTSMRSIFERRALYSKANCSATNNSKQRNR